MTSADSLSFRLQASLKNSSLVGESDRQKRTASVADRCRVCGKAKTRLPSCVLLVQIGQNRSEIARRRLLVWLYKRPEVVPFQDSGLFLIRTTVPWFTGYKGSLQKPSRIKGRGSMDSGRNTDQEHSMSSCDVIELRCWKAFSAKKQQCPLTVAVTLHLATAASCNNPAPREGA